MTVTFRAKRWAWAVLGLCLPWLASACGGDANDGAAPQDPPRPAGRVIEEGDIVRLEGERLYVLNRWKGLLILDVASPLQPRVIGHLRLQGEPVELYFRRDHVVAIVKHPIDPDLCPSCDRRPSADSMVSVIDVSAPARPRLAGKVGVAGAVSDTRLIGEILYAVAGGGTIVHAVDLRDLARPRAADRLDLRGGSQHTHVHVTDTAFYVAAVDAQGEAIGECSPSRRGCTRLTAIDVTDPTGRLRRGASYALEGVVVHRWALDHHRGTLRLIVPPARRQDSLRPAQIRTFRASTAFELEPLANVPLETHRPEHLTAVRFDGPRAYAVTFQQIDPLFTIDLSDPARPRVVGELETPGWLDYIVPRGDRLIALGRDRDAVTGVLKLHASIYDVADLARPRLLSRELFGQGPHDRLPGSPDEFEKVVKLVDQLGLILVPFQTAGDEGALQLFTFTRDTVTRAGQVAHAGAILRAVPLDGAHVMTISHQSAEVVDVASPFSPRVAARLDLARDVLDVVRTARHQVVLWAEPGRKGRSLSVLPRGTDDPFAPALDSLPLGLSDAEHLLLADEGRIVVLAPASDRLTSFAIAEDRLVEIRPPNRAPLSFSSVGGTGAQGALDPGTTFQVLPGGLVALASASEDRRSPAGSTVEVALVDVTKHAPAVGSVLLPDAQGARFLGLSRGHLRLWTAQVAASSSPGLRALASSSLVTIDVSDPTRPVVVARSPLPGFLRAAGDDWVFLERRRPVFDSDGLFAAPIGGVGVVGPLVALGPAVDVTAAVEGDRAVAHSRGRLMLFDLSGAEGPRLVTTTTDPVTGGVRALVAGHVFLDGAQVFDARGNGLRLRTRLPSARPPRTVRLETTAPSGGVLRAYFAGGTDGVQSLALD